MTVDKCTSGKGERGKKKKKKKKKRERKKYEVTPMTILSFR
jgi:hypothetical protein